MFCIQDTELHSSHPPPPRRIIRTFRSHKSLKSAVRTQDVVHQRHPSNISAVSAARSSTESCRPSTSRGDRVVDWDPLRLHPPLAASHLPFTPQQQNNTRSHHQDLRSPRSLHNLHGTHASVHPSQPEHHQPTKTRTVIYGGFDFGFDQMSSSHRRREPMHDFDDIYQDRAPSPSNSSTTSGSDFGPATPSDVQGPAGWGGFVNPRPHPAGMDSADHFIKRGGWKRRGIIFEAEIPMAGEEECFDLEMD